MADITWFKVLTNIFEDEKIKIIQSMPDGDALLVMWFKLLAQAGKTNDGGYIYLNKKMPYNAGMLSTLFGKTQQTVEVALNAFQQFGMLDIDDKGYIFITNWEKHQNIEGMDKIREDTRKRVQKHREKKRVELLGGDPCQYCGSPASGVDHIIPTARGGTDDESNKVACCYECNRSKNDKPLIDFLNSRKILKETIRDDLIAENVKLSKLVKLCNVTGRYIVTHSNETEEEVEKELDIDKEKDIKHVLLPDENPYRIFEQEGFGTISSFIAEQIDDLVKTYGFRWYVEAMKISVLAGKRSLRYTEAILKRWKSSGIDEPWKEDKPNGRRDAGNRRGAQGMAGQDRESPYAFLDKNDDKWTMPEDDPTIL